MNATKTIGLVAVLVVLVSAGSAQGLSLWDDRILFHGLVKTQWGIFLQSQERYGMGGNAFQMGRGTLQLETTVKLHERAKFFLLFRGVRELEYDAEVDVPSGFYDEEDVREIYLDVDITEQFHVRIGRQQVVWGEADYLRILDIINPRDLGWHIQLEPWEDIRTPNYMIRAFYRFPSILRSSLEVVWVPGWDDEEDRVNRLPPDGISAIGRWTPHPTDIPQDLPPGPINLNQHITQNFPSRSVKDSNFGLRWEAMIGDFQFALAYYYTFNYDPVIVLKDQTVGFSLFPLAVNIDLFVDLEHERIHIPGASCNYYWDRIGTVIRGEFALYVDQPYNAWEIVEMMGTESTNYFSMTKKHTIKYMIGLDRPTMIRWLNKYSAWLLTGQFVQNIILDHEDNIVVTGYTTPIDDVVTQIAVGAQTNYMHGKLWPTIGGAYDFNGAFLVQLALEYKPNDWWRINLKSNLFFAHSDYESLGLFRNKDELILELIFQW